MNLDQQTSLNKFGKALAKPLSRLFANRRIERFSLQADAYLCILLGKGAGSGWALDVEVEAAASVIRHPQPVIFDVGANTGEWSLLMRRHCPSASQFFLFEPQPACQAIIRERQISNSTLVPNAVSSSSGQTVELFVDSDTSGLASLHERRDSYFDGINFSPIHVKTVSIDDVVEEYQLDRIDLLKMDVEGHELSVLEGAKRSLESGRIRALTFEFGSGNINSRTFFHDFWDMLTALDYIIFRILPSGRLMRIGEYYEDCEYFRGVTNYVATLR